MTSFDQSPIDQGQNALAVMPEVMPSELDFVERFRGPAAMTLLALTLAGCAHGSAPIQAGGSDPNAYPAATSAPSHHRSAPTPRAESKAHSADRRTYGARILLAANKYAGTKAAKDLEGDLDKLGCAGVKLDGEISKPEWYAVGRIQERAELFPSHHSYGDVGPKTAGFIRYAVVKNDTGACKAVRIKDRPKSAPGCGNNYGPPVPGTVCVDRTVPIKDPKLPLGCPGSAIQGPVAGPVKCSIRPGQPSRTR